MGLAAAAHALERGLEPIVLEAGPEAAHAVRQWSHVRMFSPWEYNIDKAAERLEAALHRADKQMYQQKKAYYEGLPHDRRGQDATPG